MIKKTKNNLPKLEIIYEDNHLLAIKKPYNILTQADKTGEISLYDIAKKYLKVKYHKPGQVFLGLVHRLDRPVAGIILFAKTSKAASRLSKQFRERTIIKKYLALVEGNLPIGENKRLIHYLLKNPKNNTVKVANIFFNNSKKAILDYQVIPNKNIKKTFNLPSKIINCSLLEINLHTGLSHQIRAQLSSVGHPILGDKKYNSKIFLPAKNIALIANQLTFQHPTTKKTIFLKI